MLKSWYIPVAARAMKVGADYSGDLFTPGTVQNEMRVVDGAVEALDRDISAAQNLPENFKVEWEAFKSEWKEFYSENDNIISRAFNKTYASVLEYRDRANDWRKRFVAL